MTMPHLQNCPHSQDAHCLDCVARAHAESERKIQNLQAVIDRLKLDKTVSRYLNKQPVHKQLVVLPSVYGPLENLYLLVNPYVEKSVIANSVCAVLHEVTSEIHKNDDGLTDDGKTFKASVTERLTEDGFISVEHNVSVPQWDVLNTWHMYPGPLRFQLRLQNDDIESVRSPNGNQVVITTKVGDLVVNLRDQSYSGQGTSGTIKGTGYKQFVTLIKLRNE